MDWKNDLTDTPTKLLWLLYSNIKETPLPLLLLLLFTCVLSGFAFVRPQFMLLAGFIVTKSADTWE